MVQDMTTPGRVGGAKIRKLRAVATKQSTHRGSPASAATPIRDQGTPR
jgi:hypothetical protein